MFWYEKNLQGDIVAVYNSSGTKLVSYNYTDAWGNHSISYSNGGASTGAQYNPFRYRGYYYDTDLYMYYLQSRYYDAKICRFINADIYVSTGQGMIGFNMFAYCNNNPVNYIDPCGDNLTELLKYLVFYVKNFIRQFQEFKTEDINEEKGGPLPEKGAGAMEPVTDADNYSKSQQYYREGGSRFLLEKMYEDFYNTIKLF